MQVSTVRAVTTIGIDMCSTHFTWNAGIAAWIAFYNIRCPHQALGHHTPMATAGAQGWRLDNPNPYRHRASGAT